MEYVLHLAIIVSLYAILALSLNLLAGFTGLVSVAHAAFFGLGAYVTAWLAISLHSPFLLNVFIAVCAAAALGAVVATPLLRVHDDYFVLATFAVQVVAFSVFNNWVGITGGPMGLRGVEAPSIRGVALTSHWQFLGLVSLFALATYWVLSRVTGSPYGRVLRAVREDEVFALSLGKNVAAYKIAVFVLSAIMASLAGSLYASYITFVDPGSFTVMESVFILAIVIVGGAESLWGSVVGAVLLVLLPEVLRFLGLPVSIGAALRQMLYGGLLVVLMVFRPQGLLGRHGFGR